jgi:hypothetical protein
VALNASVARALLPAAFDLVPDLELDPDPDLDWVLIAPAPLAETIRH